MAPRMRSTTAAGWWETDGRRDGGEGAAAYPAPYVAWIVCEGAPRDVSDGLVPCPYHGPTPVSVCMDCHLLETLAAERDPRLSCAMPGSAP